MNLYILLGIILVVGWIALVYNRLISTKTRCEQTLKDIDIQLKKRYDLLPDLIETAKSAMKLDEHVLTEITKLRTQGLREIDSKAPLSERSKIESKLSELTRSIQIQVENYPKLESHTELSKLMDGVTYIEERIAAARQFYNSNVSEFNMMLAQFPSNLIAQSFHFTPFEFFAASDTEKQDIKVKLD